VNITTTYTTANGKLSQPINREKTVAVLGSSKENEFNKPYLDMATDLSYDLARDGYNIVTGGTQGTMKAANTGAWKANPSKSWAINVTAWREKHDKQIFNDLGEVATGAERTNLFSEIAKYWVIFPGGPGSLQEAAVGGESKYYKCDSSPEKIILVGKKYHKPLYDFLMNMNFWKLATDAEKTYEIADTKAEILEKITGKKMDAVA
jgi:predicted Rossmann-fold nucleotide-binding protein